MPFQPHLWIHYQVQSLPRKDQNENNEEENSSEVCRSHRELAFLARIGALLVTGLYY
jgi:hypothetical protein